MKFDEIVDREVAEMELSESQKSALKGFDEDLWKIEYMEEGVFVSNKNTKFKISEDGKIEEFEDDTD